RHLVRGLRVTVAWEVPGPDASRKLSTLRFIAQSFQRHLERLLTLEEHDGYLGLVRASSPRLGRATDVLAAEHERFRSQARGLVQRLERRVGTDLAGLGQLCADLLGLLADVERHSKKELALLQEAFGQDGGGGEG